MPTVKGRSAQYAIGENKKRNTRYGCISAVPLAGWLMRQILPMFLEKFGTKSFQ